ncbi:MAG: class II aldolase/adducin family protein [Gemmataceae bacterium]|nr:class II aldolase/adducin family protein [Gemmataceae bacterium]
MMNEYQIKQEICEIGRRVYNRGFAAANDGNISVRLNAKEIICSPTMVSKGFMKPDDICKVDYEGKQLAGTRKRSSEILLHLSVYKHRPDVMAVVHCHPPHATAFAVAHEPIPKCVLPEVEVFLGEVPIAVYETPGGQKFADTIVPYLKDCNTILLANHGTVTFGPTLEKAYWNSEIIDAYCRILILAKQLGRVNYFSDGKTKELLDLKKKLGYDDPRLRLENCDTCGNSIFDRGYSEFVPEAVAFAKEQGAACSGACPVPAEANGQDMDKLVSAITDQVLAALGGARA